MGKRKALSLIPDKAGVKHGTKKPTIGKQNDKIVDLIPTASSFDFQIVKKKLRRRNSEVTIGMLENWSRFHQTKAPNLTNDIDCLFKMGQRGKKQIHTYYIVRLPYKDREHGAEEP